MFLGLRRQAFIQAGLAPPPPALAIVSLPQRLVFFG
jgi:hypothetical protein